jgi:hypothetical protein
VVAGVSLLAERRQALEQNDWLTRTAHEHAE